MNWWQNKPRKINVIVDNDSWIIPFAYKLVRLINSQGDQAKFFSSYDNLYKNKEHAHVSFYLGCIKITPSELLKKSKKNLVIHESDLPHGKGFSPLTWQILAGKNTIPICLLEMATEIDSGPIVYKDLLTFGGHELISELRKLQGEKTINLCLKYLRSPMVPKTKTQRGKSTYYLKRTPKDSRLDPNKTLSENFNLLRVVDNIKYPAYFELHGYRYVLQIKKNKKIK